MNIIQMLVESGLSEDQAWEEAQRMAVEGLLSLPATDEDES